MSATIRPATLADVPQIADLGERFHTEAGWPEIAAPYIAEDCAKSLCHLVESPCGVILIAETEGRIVGMAGALAHPFYFNASHRHAGELFWWVKPGLRDGTGSALFDKLEEWARSIGCQTFAMSAVERLKPELMRRLYARRGYVAAEHTFIKRLGA
jgi:GNAT superfamily N-acetyltransferase